MKLLALVVIAFLFMLSCWLFFWPLVECIYAISWEPLISNSMKFILFCFGGMVFVIGFIVGIRFVI